MNDLSQETIEYCIELLRDSKSRITSSHDEEEILFTKVESAIYELERHRYEMYENPAPRGE